MNTAMNNELTRLNTYARAENINCASAWARSGFYFDDELKTLNCFSCNLSLNASIYTRLDVDFDNLHRQQAHQCRFINGHDKENVDMKLVPIEMKQRIELSSTSKSLDCLDAVKSGSG